MKKDLIATITDNRLNPTFVVVSLLVQHPLLKALKQYYIYIIHYEKLPLIISKITSKITSKLVGAAPTAQSIKAILHLYNALRKINYL